MSWSFEKVAGPYKGPTVGLAWDGRALYFTTTVDGIVYRMAEGAGEPAVFRRYQRRIGGIGFATDGDFFACQEACRRIVQFAPDGATLTTATFLDGRIHNYPNDLTVDAKGRVWFSDPYHAVPALGIPRPPLDHASVLRLERDANRAWQLVRITHDTNSPRAVLLSRDEKTLYVSHGEAGGSEHCELRAYPVRPDGSVGDPVSLVTFGQDARGTHRGIEGMCLDSEGNLVACAGSRASGPGPAVMVISPEGHVLATHPLPFDLPMRCAFGGTDLATLYVTSGDGAVYRAKTDRRGTPKYQAR